MVLNSSVMKTEQVSFNVDIFYPKESDSSLALYFGNQILSKLLLSSG